MSPGVPQLFPYGHSTQIELILPRRARGAARKKVSVLTADLGGIGMLKNVGKDGFEILGQTGVPPVTKSVLASPA